MFTYVAHLATLETLNMLEEMCCALASRGSTSGLLERSAHIWLRTEFGLLEFRVRFLYDRKLLERLEWYLARKRLEPVLLLLTLPTTL